MSKTYTIVTGASAGIGKATAEVLAKAGRNLMLVARREDRLNELKKTLMANHSVDVLTFEVDVQDIGQVDRFFENIKDKEVDALINNAGLARSKESLENYKWSDIEEMLMTNIRGALRMAQLAIPFLKKTKGHIVNISSIAGLEAYEGGTVYCGTKAFVKMMSRGLRHDLLGSGVRVSDIAPGAVETEFSVVRYHGDEAKAKKTYEGFVPLYPEDIADCIAFALSRPAHVNIDYMLVLPTAQASISRIVRK